MTIPNKSGEKSSEYKNKRSRIELTVWEFNSDAIKFYESLGMTTRNRRMELKKLRRDKSCQKLKEYWQEL